jgi:environmental stress-induced protein Ves
MSVVSPQIIELRDCAPTPWKNGAGLTREIAVEPPDASIDDFGWRISVAEISRDAPFSAFAGVDRRIVLIAGHGMWLRSAGGAVDMRLDEPLAPFGFSGEEPVTAQLIDGACADFNVMVRKQVWRADVIGATDSTATRDLDASSAALVFCVRGAASIAAAEQAAAVLGAGQAALWRSKAPRRRLRVDAPGTQVLIVQLHAVCQDAGA